MLISLFGTTINIPLSPRLRCESYCQIIILSIVKFMGLPDSIPESLNSHRESDLGGRSASFRSEQDPFELSQNSDLHLQRRCCAVT